MKYNEDKPERCSTKPFCEHLDKIRGTYHCTLTNEEVDNGDEEDGSDYIFMRTKSCMGIKMNPDTEKAWREDCRKAIKEFDESGALATNEVPDNLRHAYFRAGYLAACKARTEEQRKKNKDALEALNELTNWLGIEQGEGNLDDKYNFGLVNTIKAALEEK